MTTMDVPTFGQFVTLRLAKLFANREKAKQASPAHTWIQSVIRLVLHLMGFSCLTYAGFLWHTAAGFVIAGISFFLLSWLMTGNAKSNTARPQPQDPLMFGRDKR